MKPKSYESLKSKITKEDLKIDELKVVELTETEECYLFIAEPKEKMVVCPYCKSYQVRWSGKDTRTVYDIVNVNNEVYDEIAKRYKINNISIPVKIKIQGHRNECTACNKKFPQLYSFIGKGEDITNRFKEHITKEAFIKPFKKINAEFGISPATAQIYFKKAVISEDAKREWIAPEILNVCQIALNKIRLPLITDGQKGEILEIPLQNDKMGIDEFLRNMKEANRVKLAIVSMFAAHKEAVKAVFPNIPIVVNKYYCEKAINYILHLIQKEIKKILPPQEIKKWALAFNLMFVEENDLVRSNIETRNVLFEKYSQIKPAYEITNKLKKIYWLTIYCDVKEAYELWLSDLKKWESSLKTWVLNQEVLSEISNTINLFSSWKSEILAYWELEVYKIHQDKDISAQINELIHTILKYGRTYSYEIARGKILYGSKATTRSEFAEPNIKYNAMSMVTSFEPILLRGFSVNIAELLACIKNDPNFFS